MKHFAQVQKMLTRVMLAFGWAPITVFFIHVIGSSVFRMYRYYPWIDIPMHFLGGLSIAYFLYGLYSVTQDQKVLGKPVFWLQYLTVFALTGTTTVFWEFTEFLSDYFLGTRQQGGLFDTMKDMFLGIMGAVGFLLLRRIYKQK